MHVKHGRCGTIARGDGFLLTEEDVACNEAADKLAKVAVEQHRVPYRIRKAIEAHDALTTQNAMWIARATLIANQQVGGPGRDTQASKAGAAEAAAEKRRLKKQQQQQQKPTLVDPRPGRGAPPKPGAWRIEATSSAD